MKLYVADLYNNDVDVSSYVKSVKYSDVLSDDSNPASIILSHDREWFYYADAGTPSIPYAYDWEDDTPEQDIEDLIAGLWSYTAAPAASCEMLTKYHNNSISGMFSDGSVVAGLGVKFLFPEASPSTPVEYPLGSDIEDHARWSSGAGLGIDDDDNDGTMDATITCPNSDGDQKLYFVDTAAGGQVGKVYQFVTDSPGAGIQRVTVEINCVNNSDSHFFMYLADSLGNPALIVGFINTQVYLYQSPFIGHVVSESGSPITPVGEHTYEFWLDETNETITIYYDDDLCTVADDYDDYHTSAGAIRALAFATADAAMNCQIYVDNINPSWDTKITFDNPYVQFDYETVAGTTAGDYYFYMNGFDDTDTQQIWTALDHRDVNVDWYDTGVHDTGIDSTKGTRYIIRFEPCTATTYKVHHGPYSTGVLTEYGPFNNFNNNSWAGAWEYLTFTSGSNDTGDVHVDNFYCSWRLPEFEFSSPSPSSWEVQHVKFDIYWDTHLDEVYIQSADESGVIIRYSDTDDKIQTWSETEDSWIDVCDSDVVETSYNVTIFFVGTTYHYFVIDGTTYDNNGDLFRNADVFTGSITRIRTQTDSSHLSSIKASWLGFQLHDVVDHKVSLLDDDDDYQWIGYVQSCQEDQSTKRLNLNLKDFAVGMEQKPILSKSILTTDTINAVAGEDLQLLTLHDTDGVLVADWEECCATIQENESITFYEDDSGGAGADESFHVNSVSGGSEYYGSITSGAVSDTETRNSTYMQIKSAAISGMTYPSYSFLLNMTQDGGIEGEYTDVLEIPIRCKLKADFGAGWYGWQRVHASFELKNYSTGNFDPVYTASSQCRGMWSQWIDSGWIEPSPIKIENPSNYINSSSQMQFRVTMYLTDYNQDQMTKPDYMYVEIDYLRVKFKTVNNPTEQVHCRVPDINAGSNQIVMDTHPVIGTYASAEDVVVLSRSSRTMIEQAFARGNVASADVEMDRTIPCVFDALGMYPRTVIQNVASTFGGYWRFKPRPSDGLYQAWYRQKLKSFVTVEDFCEPSWDTVDITAVDPKSEMEWEVYVDHGNNVVDIDNAYGAALILEATDGAAMHQVRHKLDNTAKRLLVYEFSVQDLHTDDTALTPADEGWVWFELQDADNNTLFWIQKQQVTLVRANGDGFVAVDLDALGFDINVTDNDFTVFRLVFEDDDSGEFTLYAKNDDITNNLTVFNEVGSGYLTRPPAYAMFGTFYDAAQESYNKIAIGHVYIEYARHIGLYDEEWVEYMNYAPLERNIFWYETITDIADQRAFVYRDTTTFQKYMRLSHKMDHVRYLEHTLVDGDSISIAFNLDNIDSFMDIMFGDVIGPTIRISDDGSLHVIRWQDDVSDANVDVNFEGLTPGNDVATELGSWSSDNDVSCTTNITTVGATDLLAVVDGNFAGKAHCEYTLPAGMSTTKWERISFDLYVTGGYGDIMRVFLTDGSDEGPGFQFNMGAFNDILEELDGTDIVSAAFDGNWMRFELYFNIALDKWYFSIASELYTTAVKKYALTNSGNFYDFQNALSSITTMVFETNDASSGQTMYIDNIDLSWTDNTYEDLSTTLVADTDYVLKAEHDGANTMIVYLDGVSLGSFTVDDWDHYISLVTAGNDEIFLLRGISYSWKDGRRIIPTEIYPQPNPSITKKATSYSKAIVRPSRDISNDDDNDFFSIPDESRDTHLGSIADVESPRVMSLVDHVSVTSFGVREKGVSFMLDHSENKENVVVVPYNFNTQYHAGDYISIPKLDIWNQIIRRVDFTWSSVDGVDYREWKLELGESGTPPNESLRRKLVGVDDYKVTSSIKGL